MPGEIRGNPVDIGYSDRREDERPDEGSWHAVASRLKERGSPAGEQLSRLSPFQKNALDLELNMAGYDKGILSGLDDGELASLVSGLQELGSAADKEAAEKIAKRVAEHIG